MKKIILVGIITVIIVGIGILFISGFPDSAIGMSESLPDREISETTSKIELSESMSMGNP